MNEPRLEGERILVTGAAGSIGTRLVEKLLWSHSSLVEPTDRDTMDVTSYLDVEFAFTQFRPTLVFHLAGAKHAPLGEEDPTEAAAVNITGTEQVLHCARNYGARVVTASTCKACNPETAYGATKLIAERMTLNAGGSVARFYNVRETCGNVFAIWKALPASEPIPITACTRRFMSVDDAVRLLVWCAVLEPGRYTIAGARSENMWTVASQLYPGRAVRPIPLRRGDRRDEPAWATQETVSAAAPGIVRVVSPHDQAAVAEEVAA